MAKELKAMAEAYPVVTVTGPRQSGKTTLVREVFPKKPYVNLESLGMRSLAEADPGGFLDQFPTGAILDEIQRFPELLSEVQVRVDEKDEKGMFILTGSHQVGLRGAITQSLAGRTAILHLLPMSLQELEGAKMTPDLDEALLKGGFPRIWDDSLDPAKAYGNYVQTYVERDVRQMIEVKNLQLFQKFLKLCAGRIGQILNKESLGNEVGVSAKTIDHWLSILVASYLVFLLPPYFENFGKRTIKSPKLFFSDTGLAAWLLGIETTKQMERDPLRGNLVENLVILELMKDRWNRGLEPRLYFWQDSQKNEIDALFQQGNDLIPIEIKSAKTFNPAFLKGIKAFRKLVEGRCSKSFLVYSGSEEVNIQGTKLLHYSNAAEALKE